MSRTGFIQKIFCKLNKKLYLCGMLFEQYKEYLLKEIKNSTILVEKKMVLLDAVDSISEDIILDENDVIFLIFRTYGIEVETFRTFSKNQRLDKFLS